ncbi:MAG: type II/IV secretion system protein [Bdellovibrionales bacterium]|nr:type II/IV secretion system protein [Bdellovibrionales bacterium]
MNATLALLKLLEKHQLLSSIPTEDEANQWTDGPLLTLAREGRLEEQQTARRVAEVLGLDFVDLEEEARTGRIASHKLAGLVDPAMLWEPRIIPIAEEGDRLIVAVSNPFDRDSIAALEFVLSKSVKQVVAEESKILPLLARHFPSSKFRYFPGVQDNEGARVEFVGESTHLADVSRADSNLPPVVRLVNRIIFDAARFHASDIHLEPSDTGVQVRFRIDGEMQDIIEIPRDLRKATVARCKVLAGMDIAERRRPQDGRLRVRVDQRILDMRLSTIPTAHGEKLVARLFHHDYESLVLPAIGVPLDLEQHLLKALGGKGKMLLVTGPTGAGKTTTLYACLNTVRDGKSNITTIEDPIEYRLRGINQIQVNRATDVTFASALRSVLRQDPDVIMIGEIRDSETLSIALQAAQTGHLVLSTVHTNDAPSAVTRLLALGADPYLLSSGLTGIVAQRLVRRICHDCAKPASQLYLDQHEDLIQAYGLEASTLLEAVGCEACFDIGYKGRIGLFSYLQFNEEIAELVFTASSQEVIRRAARRYGFRELDEAAVKVVNDRQTSLNEVRPFLLQPEPQRAPAAEHVPSTSSSLIPLVHEVATDGRAVSIGRRAPAVLVIDDNRFSRKMICAMLRHDRIQVIQAENGLEALDKVYAHGPSVILCDLSMPQMDGREFIERMKGDKMTRDIPIIVLTADDCEHTELDLLRLGAREFLSKKSSPEIIAGRVRNVLKSL